jgi:hypothetical protein
METTKEKGVDVRPRYMIKRTETAPGKYHNLVMSMLHMCIWMYAGVHVCVR